MWTTWASALILTSACGGGEASGGGASLEVCPKTSLFLPFPQGCICQLSREGSWFSTGAIITWYLTATDNRKPARWLFSLGLPESLQEAASRGGLGQGEGLDQGQGLKWWED